MIHLYIGNGKGKTTAAAGLAARMAGIGGKVLFMQFLKNGTSGEISVLKTFTDVKYCFYGRKFLFEMSDAEKKSVRDDILNMLSGTDISAYDLIVMDEILDCIAAGIVFENEISDFLNADAEIVLTGRNASDAIKEKADYISEIKNIKHPFDNGVAARKGIEY